MLERQTLLKFTAVTSSSIYLSDSGETGIFGGIKETFAYCRNAAVMKHLYKRARITMLRSVACAAALEAGMWKRVGYEVCWRKQCVQAKYKHSYRS